MGKKLRILVKPPVKTIYLKNSTNEKVTYLDFSDSNENYSLREDIRGGGVQFKELEKLINKKRMSRVVSVSADSLEMGLMGIAYLAIEGVERYYRSGDIEIPFWNEDNTWILEEIIEHLPVIELTDIMHYLMSDDMPFEDNGYLMQRQHAKNNRKPYWFDWNREPVCIIVKRERAETGCLDILSLFAKNRNVFVLFLEEEKQNTGMELPFGVMDKEHFNAMRNNFILSNAADAVEITLEDENRRKYYRNILKNNLMQRGIKTKRGFSYDRIISLAESVNKNSMCEMIDKIIDYALKDVEDSNGVVFENKSFDFVNAFSNEKKSGQKGVSGRRLLEENLVGMEDIKHQVYDVVNVMKYNKLRAEMNISGSNYHNVHLMLGAPGTAKTTVAKYMGKIMMDEKLLPDSRFVCINGAQLKGMYVGHSAPKTKNLFEKYDVIIIDEAYSIVEHGGGTDSFGNEAIAQMIIELERHSTDKLVIFAGYGGKGIDEKDNRMKDFLEANPGIKSRITSTFYFKSYTAEDMREIFLRIAKLSNFELEDGIGNLVKDFFEKQVKRSDFGNGREARALLENSALFAARRLMESGKKEFEEKEMKLLTLEDVQNAVKKAEACETEKKEKIRKIGFM